MGRPETSQTSKVREQEDQEHVVNDALCAHNAFVAHEACLAHEAGQWYTAFLTNGTFLTRSNDTDDEINHGHSTAMNCIVTQETIELASIESSGEEIVNQGYFSYARNASALDETIELASIGSSVEDSLPPQPAAPLLDPCNGDQYNENIELARLDSSDEENSTRSQHMRQDCVKPCEQMGDEQIPLNCTDSESDSSEVLDVAIEDSKLVTVGVNFPPIPSTESNHDNGCLNALGPLGAEAAFQGESLRACSGETSCPVVDSEDIPLGNLDSDSDADEQTEGQSLCAGDGKTLCPAFESEEIHLGSLESESDADGHAEGPSATSPLSVHHQRETPVGAKASAHSFSRSLLGTCETGMPKFAPGRSESPKKYCEIRNRKLLLPPPKNISVGETKPDCIEMMASRIRLPGVTLSRLTAQSQCAASAAQVGDLRASKNPWIAPEAHSWDATIVKRTLSPSLRTGQTAKRRKLGGNQPVP